MSNNGDNSNQLNNDNSDGPEKAQIDRWIDGEVSTTSILDKILTAIGVAPRK